MAHLSSLISLMFLGVLVHLSAPRSVQDVHREQQFSLTVQEIDPCKIVTFGSWADRINFTVVPNPLYYEKQFTVYAEFYVYEDLVFGTSDISLVQVDRPWSYSHSGHLCEASLMCPWHKGETKTLHQRIPAPSTAVDKGTYNLTISIYNDVHELILGVRIQNCTLI